LNYNRNIWPSIHTRIGLVLVVLLLINWNCKEKVVSNQSLKEVKVTKQISPEIKELLNFAKITFTDTIKPSSILVFKHIDENGKISMSDAETTSKLYKDLKKGRSTSSNLIFEIIKSDTMILVAQNRGFSGPIWVKILIDKKRKEILDLQFGHMAESEGYGAGITQNSFENQFVGVNLDPDSKVLGLRQNSATLIEGTYMIDGISGATITSKAAVEMINQGLQKYGRHMNQP
jgi:Na+-transporting NADH:ubiquinone oxidoreductase subunit C